MTSAPAGTSRTDRQAARRLTLTAWLIRVRRAVALLCALALVATSASAARTQSALDAQPTAAHASRNSLTAPLGPLGRGEARPGGTPARSDSEDGASTRRTPPGEHPCNGAGYSGGIPGGLCDPNWGAGCFRGPGVQAAWGAMMFGGTVANLAKKAWGAIGGFFRSLLSARAGTAGARAAAEAAAVAAREAGTGRVFWSGGEGAKQAADSYAAATGGTTLEMTAAGRALEGAALPWPEAAPLWKAASGEFAADARGTADVFLSRAARAESIWTNIERPLLQGSGTSIRVHLAIIQ
jgi:hypothetical protein